MKKALFPGSFDPLTNGHVDIIRRASILFDEVTVLVGCNMKKNTLFSPSERIKMIQSSLSSFVNVKVDMWDGLTVKYAEMNCISVIVRGLRDSGDYEYERKIENGNRYINPSIETVYLSSSSENLYLSSSAVREYLKFGVDISPLVPRPVLEEIEKKMKRGKLL